MFVHNICTVYVHNVYMHDHAWGKLISTNMKAIKRFAKHRLVFAAATSTRWLNMLWNRKTRDMKAGISTNFPDTFLHNAKWLEKTFGSICCPSCTLTAEMGTRASITTMTKWREFIRPLEPIIRGSGHQMIWVANHKKLVCHVYRWFQSPWFLSVDASDGALHVSF